MGRKKWFTRLIVEKIQLSNFKGKNIRHQTSLNFKMKSSLTRFDKILNLTKLD